MATVKALLVLQVLKIVLPCVMTYTFLVAMLMLNLVFTLPAAYNLKHEHISAALGPHVEKARLGTSTLMQRVPRYTQFVKDM